MYVHACIPVVSVSTAAVSVPLTAYIRRKREEG